ncbi:RNA-directed DNA polymerase, eukaryota [Tanacetum coccineum]
MWVSVIKAINGPCGNLDRDIPVGKSSTWLDCIRSISHLKGRGVDLYLCMKKKVGDEKNKEVSIHDKVQNGLLFGFRRTPRGGAEDGEGVFSVSSARRFIDEGLCVMDGSPTRWLKLIPIKVNILAWRLASNKLPTRFNMSLRGLEVSSIERPVCHEGVETSYHLFFSCSAAYAIVSRFLGWWGLPDIGISAYQG